jgi:hypothetical protein
MPILETALYNYLTGDAGVAALVGDRVYPVRIPPGTNAQPTPLPAISFQRITASRTYTYDSFADTSAWVRARVQFSCWSHSAQEAIEVGEAVLLALSGYNGDMSGKVIGQSSAELELDDYDAGGKLFRRVVDFFIYYEDESAAS